MKALVLLSGGLDSTAALHWALERCPDVRALGFRYGQPQADHELRAAGFIAARLDVPFSTARFVELPRLDPTPGLRRPGVSNAFVPGRNLLFLARAAAAAATGWPGERVRLVVGFNRDDASGFPDCRPSFLAPAARAIAEALSNVVEIALDAPWVAATKREILEWARHRPLALRDLRDSVSCYRGIRCGACDACALRARAFAEAQLEDGTPVYRTHDGELAREAGCR